MNNPLSTLNETKTLLDAQNDNETAFAELVKQNLPAIYRYLFRLTGNETTMEDLTQKNL